MPLLNDLLRSTSRLKTSERAHLSRALGFPWCWPGAPEALEAARGLCQVEPGEPELGQVCLVSVSPAASRAALWCFGPQLAGHAHGVPLGHRAAEALEVALAVAARDLPLLGDPTPSRRRHRWGAICVTRDGDGLDHVLDGSSYGLAMSLAVGSLFLQQPVPANLVASAVVNRDGSLGPVGALSRKLDLVFGSALRARRLVVFEEQAEQAKAAARDRGRAALDVVGVRSLADAFTRVFALEERLQHQQRLWPTTASAIRATAVFYRTALDSRPVLLDWRGFAKTATALQRRLCELEGRTAEMAGRDIDFALQVARRHAGQEALLAWPSESYLASLLRQRRLEMLAHVVQSAADATDHACRDYVDRAVRHLADPLERHEADLALLGAIGRARAATGDYGEAAEALREALDGWRALGREDRSSHALCEYLRVLGLLDRLEAIDRARRTFVVDLEHHPQTDPASRAFVALALGRAWCQAGAPEPGCEALADGGDVDWELTPEHVMLSRLRWLARCLALDERAEEAAAVRQQLEATGPAESGGTDIVLLARIDGALEGGRDPTPALHMLLEDRLRGHEARRLLARLRHGMTLEDGTPKLETVRALADEYRY